MKVLFLKILLILIPTFIGLTLGGASGLFIAFLSYIVNPSHPFTYLPMTIFGLVFGVYGLFRGIQAICH
jgi:hypothetical protein